MTHNKTTYYIAQEKAFATGIVKEWPEVIKHPLDKNGRLVKCGALAGIADLEEFVAAAKELLSQTKETVDRAGYAINFGQVRRAIEPLYESITRAEKAFEKI